MLHYSFIRNALLAASLVSLLCPLIGTFVVLKKYSMLGDTLSHSSLAGISIGILFGFNPILSAFIFTGISGLLIELLRSKYERYEELIMVIILTFSVGIAITLVSSGLVNTNIDTYLFGSILTVSKSDLYTILSLSLVSITTIFFMYNKLIYVTFDEEGARVSGLNIKRINFIFMLLVSATVSVSIRIMGMLVISSMIAVPVATSLQLNKSFKFTLIFSIVFGFIDTITGLILSLYFNAAPGGLIALVSISVLLAVIIIKSFRK